VDAPDSERAPHQSRCDFKYYVRLGGKSRPAPHRLSRHPKLQIHDLRIQNVLAGEFKKISGLRSGLELRILLSFNVRNAGRVRASTSCFQIHANIPLSMSDREYFTKSANQGAVLIELKNPSYTEMSFPLAVPINISAEVQVLQEGNL
jgi:hypothetical protein